MTTLELQIIKNDRRPIHSSVLPSTRLSNNHHIGVENAENDHIGVENAENDHIGVKNVAK